MIQLERLSFNSEKQILINLILYDDYCARVLPSIREDYFRSNYIYRIVKWVKKYHKKYDKAPKEHIQAEFEKRIKGLDKEEALYIEGVLEHLSNCASTEVHNMQYLVDTANEYLKNRHREIQITTAQKLIDSGKEHEADLVWNDEYISISGNSYDVLDFSSRERIIETTRYMIERNEPETVFFKFEGKLGDFIGNIDPGWLVGILAPAKRGKTTYMLDAAVAALLLKRNTLIFSHEMTLKEIHSRYLVRTTGCIPGVPTYTAKVPVFDCGDNQNGECVKSKRIGSGSVVAIEDDGSVTTQTYDDDPSWKICTECRGTKAFSPAVWHTEVKKKEIKESAYVKKAMEFSKYVGKYCRAIYMPSRTVGVRDLRAETDALINSENFIPDIIVIDYADLLLPETSSGIKRHDLDDIWEDLRAWGKSTNTLIITASQTNRSSAGKKFIADTDVAEDYSKIAKLDVGIGLCQDDAMKAQGLMNINTVAHRHKEFVQSHVCAVLQDMRHGQATLDSEYRTA